MVLYESGASPKSGPNDSTTTVLPNSEVEPYLARSSAPALSSISVTVVEMMSPVVTPVRVCVNASTPLPVWVISMKSRYSSPSPCEESTELRKNSTR